MRLKCLYPPVRSDYNVRRVGAWSSFAQASTPELQVVRDTDALMAFGHHLAARGRFGLADATVSGDRLHFVMRGAHPDQGPIRREAVSEVNQLVLVQSPGSRSDVDPNAYRYALLTALQLQASVRTDSPDSKHIIILLNPTSV